MQIYLIAGKSGSGKGECAKIIKKYYEQNNKQVLETEFTKYLKMYAKEILGWNENSNKPRAFLQNIGEKVRNEINPLFLINRMLDDIKIYEDYFDVVIISDVRLPQEIDYLKNNYNNTKSIYLINEFGKSKLTVEEQKHHTEIALDNYNKFDITIENKDFDNLKKDVLNFLESSDN